MNIKFFLFLIPVISCLLVSYTEQALGQQIIDSSSNTGIGSEEADFLPEIMIRFSEPVEGTDTEAAEAGVPGDTGEVSITDIVNTLNERITTSDQPINDTVDIAAVEPQYTIKSNFSNFNTAVLELQSAIEGPEVLAAGELLPASNEELVIINETLNQAQNISGIQAIQPVRIFEASAQTIPVHMKRIGADSGFLKVGDGTKNVDSNIAILDTGISNHTDLNIVESVSFLNNNANDNCGHGTHVAGIAAAKDNDFGIVGSAPGADLWNLKVLDKKLNGKCTGPETAIIDALNYTIGKNIDVLNLSLGAKCTASSTLCNAPVYESIINDVISDGKIIVVAAGNKGEDAKNFIPARFDGVITVSAISDSDGLCGGLGAPTSWGPDDEFAPFSNYGTVIDVAAPGVDILSTFPNNGYSKLSGTSMASPLVAGIFASYKATHQELDLSTLKNAILAVANTPQTICSGDRGYINGNTKDSIPEPLLSVKNIVSNGGGTNLVPLSPNELANPPTGNGPLVRGDNRSTLVTHLQMILKNLGFVLGNSGPNHDGIDGNFGPLTEAAVKQFQQSHTDSTGAPLVIDGKVGRLTAEALNKAAGI